MKKIIISTIASIICLGLFILLTSQKSNPTAEQDLAYRIAKSDTYLNIRELEKKQIYQVKLEYERNKNLIAKHNMREVNLIMNSSCSSSQRRDSLAKIGYVENKEYFGLCEQEIPLFKKLIKEFPELANFSLESRKEVFHRAMIISNSLNIY